MALIHRPIRSYFQHPARLARTARVLAEPTGSPAFAIDRRTITVTAHAEIQSFGYLHNPPPPSTITVDLRECLRDPHVDPALRELTGFEAPVRFAVLNTRGAPGLIAHLAMTVIGLLELGIPVSLSVGCAGGKHRAVVVSQEVAARLRLTGWSVDLQHRDVHRPVVDRRPSTPVTGEVCP